MKVAFISRDGRLYINGEDTLKVGNTILEKTLDKGVLFVQDTNIDGVFSYGYKQTCADYWGHAPGYIWSSRASVMNNAFGLTLMDIYYKKEADVSYCSCAIDLAHLEPLLEGTEYEIDWNPYKSSDGEDIEYRLIKKEVK